MIIEIIKANKQAFLYRLTRQNGSVAHISLDTKTYLLHDICHFAVEKRLNVANGFWGMLAQGFYFQQLFGKDNPHTATLRFIEQIVGAVQSVYSGHMKERDFTDYMAHLHYDAPPALLPDCLTEVAVIWQKWKELPVGEKMLLHWDLM